MLLIRVSELISEKYLEEEIDTELLQMSSQYSPASSLPPAVFTFKFRFQSATAELSRRKKSLCFLLDRNLQQQTLFFSALARIYNVGSVFVECQFASQISYSSCVCRETIVVFPHARKSIYNMYIRKHRVYTE